MEDKVRVFEVAEEAGATSADVIAKAADLGIELKSPQSTLSFEQAEEIVNYIVMGKSSKVKKTKPKKNTKKTKQEPEKKEEATKESKPTQKEATKGVKPAKKADNKKTPKNLNEGEAPLRRRKLTIVKKKRASTTQPEKPEQSKKKAMKSMSELFGNTPEVKEEKKVAQAPKPKKAKSKTPAKSHEHGKKLDMFSARAVDDFGSTSDSLLGEEIVLDDMNLIETSRFLQETHKKQTEIRTTKPSAFGNRPRGLSRSNKKKEKG